MSVTSSTFPDQFDFENKFSHQAYSEKTVKAPPNTPVQMSSLENMPLSTSPVKRVIEAYSKGIYPNPNSPVQDQDVLNGYTLSSSPVKTKVDAFPAAHPKREKVQVEKIKEEQSPSDTQWAMDDI